MVSLLSDLCGGTALEYAELVIVIPVKVREENRKIGKKLGVGQKCKVVNWIHLASDRER